MISKNNTHFIFIFILLLSIIFSNQESKIMGKISDKSNLEPLIGAMVMLVGTNDGTISDINGEYTLVVNPGEYLLKVSYIGYDDINYNIRINTKQNMTKDFFMSAALIQADQVNVTARKKESSALSVLAAQKESVILQDGIAAEQISKTGDSNVAEGVRRITGISVVDDKFAVIRGLPERYTDTQLNSSPVTSPEPDKKAVPLDMFPTDIIENIIAVKTATPDMASTFSSGGVLVKTKAYPDNYIMKLKFGTSYKDYYSNNNIYYLGSGEGEYDMFGYDMGNRSIKNILPDFQLDRFAYANPESELMQNVNNPDHYLYEAIDDEVWGCIDDEGDMIGEITTQNSCFSNNSNNEWRVINDAHRSMQQNKIYSQYYKKMAENGFSFKKIKRVIPYSFSISNGNKFNPNRDLEWGYFINFNHKNGFKYKNYLKSRVQGSSITGELEQKFPKENYETAYSTNTGINLNFGLNIDENHTIKYQAVYSHTSKDQFRVAEGLDSYNGPVANNIDDDAYFLLDKYVEKDILTQSLSGEHIFNRKRIKRIFDWSYTYGIAKRYEPDNRRHDYESINDNPGSPFKIYSNSGEKIFGYIDNLEGDDISYNYDANFTLDMEDKFDFPFKFKTGLRTQSKDRTFEMRRLILQWGPGFESLSSSNFPDSVHIYDSFEDFGSSASNPNLGFDYMLDSQWEYGISEYNYVNPGWLILDDTPGNKTGAYTASESVDAAYIMFEFPLGFGKNKFADKFSFIGGFRFEKYYLIIDAYNPVSGTISNMIGTTDDSGGRQTIEESSVIPSVNFQYKIDNEQKLRVSYSKSINRPLFRELTPIEHQEMLDGEVSLGYPYLETTNITNYDFRYEWYPKLGEILSVSYFEKYFDNPIEVTKVMSSDLIYRVYNNAISAKTQGIEFEIRKSYSFSSNNNFQFFINTTLSESEVITYENSRVAVPYEYVDGGTFNQGITFDETCDMLGSPSGVPDHAECVPYPGVDGFYTLQWEQEGYDLYYQEFASTSGKNRPLQGQSDLILNIGFDFSFKDEFDLSISFNTFSQRVSAQGSGIGGEEYELPFNSLNISLSKGFEFGKISFKIKNLLNDFEEFGHYGAGNDSGDFVQSYIYKPGRSLSVGMSFNL